MASQCAAKLVCCQTLTCCPCHVAGLQMLGSGKLEEARNMCTQQMEEAHVKISSDADYRAGA